MSDGKVFPISKKQFDFINQVSQQIQALTAQRGTVLELILENCPDAGKEMEINSISPDGIVYTLKPLELTKED